MRQIFGFLILLLSSSILAQGNHDHYQLGGKFANEGNYEKAIEHFKQELEREPKNYFAWFNKALCESRLGEHEKSIKDFSQAIALKPDYYKAFMNRAIVKRNLTDYEGALLDLNKSLEIEENYPWAYYHRGIINEYLGNHLHACTDLKRAKELGIEKAEGMVETTCAPERKSNYANILYLSKTATDKSYGYSGDNPIKVGFGIKGGPENQRSFLNLLRDGQGNTISYKRAGSCCEYKSEHGMLGYAMSDIYVIYYLNINGEKEQTKMYLSYYEYEEPMIPMGFKTINK